MASPHQPGPRRSDSDIDLLAARNRLLVRKDLHPALQFLLLEAMREVHWPPGPFNRLGEFPAEQPSDLPLSPTAEAFYRSGPTFWQRYTSFWLTSLLNRIVFFVIPVVAMLIPVIGFAPRFYRWLYVRRIDQLHRALGNLEGELVQSADRSRFVAYQTRIAEIESAVRSLKVARPFEVDLQQPGSIYAWFKKTLVEWDRQIDARLANVQPWVVREISTISPVRCLPIWVRTDFASPLSAPVATKWPMRQGTLRPAVEPWSRLQMELQNHAPRTHRPRVVCDRADAAK